MKNKTFLVLPFSGIWILDWIMALILQESNVLSFLLVLYPFLVLDALIFGSAIFSSRRKIREKDLRVPLSLVNRSRRINRRMNP